MLLGDGHGAFSPLPTQTLDLMNMLLSSVDVDNDGDLDLLAQGTSSPPTALLLARNHGDGSDGDCCEDAPSRRGALVVLGRLIRNRHRAALNAPQHAVPN